MLPLPRHSLVQLSPRGWVRVRAGCWDAEAQSCLAHWAEHQWPLVVTRQPAGRPGMAEDELALGLPAPAGWSRRRLALQVPSAAVRPAHPFPRMAAIAPLLPRAVRAAWAGLAGAFDTERLTVRVYGSHGWQQMTGLVYLHAESDLDLLVYVDGPEAADCAVRLLAAATMAAPQLDGELLFPGGAAVAWREWAAWRAGEAAAVLVKRRDGVALARSLADIEVLPAPALLETAA